MRRVTASIKLSIPARARTSYHCQRALDDPLPPLRLAGQKSSRGSDMFGKDFAIVRIVRASHAINHAGFGYSAWSHDDDP